ncbi:MAG: RNA polymerase sigma-70 factor [Bacteroidetes bacterium]|nr:RNA polymerase sigma-70 factor [Bacteroidota bacterium]
MPFEFSNEEQDLFLKVKSGDKTAYRALFDRYYKYLVVTANNILGDSEMARDLAQDVFFELWKRRESIEVQTSLKAYLRRSVVNKTLNFIKSRRMDFTEPERMPESPYPTPDAQTLLEASDLEQVIHQAIAALPERCRLIFTLCRLEGMPHKEIAAQLDISTKTIEAQMTRAIAALREAVGPYVAPALLAWFVSGNFY